MKPKPIIRIDVETTIGRREISADSTIDAIRKVNASTMPVVRASLYDAHNQLIGTMRIRQDDRGRRWMAYYSAQRPELPTWERKL